MEATQLPTLQESQANTLWKFSSAAPTPFTTTTLRTAPSHSMLRVCLTDISSFLSCFNNFTVGTDASKTLVYGPGVEPTLLNTKPGAFTIEARDKDGKKMNKGGDDFEVKVTDANGQKVMGYL